MTAVFTQHKTRLTVIEATRDSMSVLDVAKVADILLCVVPVGDEALDEVMPTCSLCITVAIGCLAAPTTPFVH